MTVKHFFVSGVPDDPDLPEEVQGTQWNDEHDVLIDLVEISPAAQAALTGGYSGYSGKSGYSGYSGKSGYSGPRGISGYCGISGYSGASAASGTSGFSGKSGASGISGYSGYSGSSGYSGFSGIGTSGYSGYSGTSGYCGKSGYSSTSGYSGYTGVSGYSGSTGDSGYSGYSGTSGYSGYSGISGYSGYSGISGYSGYSSDSGYSGYSGENPGASGYSGYSGADGINGDSGYSGYSGKSGYSGYSGVDATVGWGRVRGLVAYNNVATPNTKYDLVSAIAVEFYVAAGDVIVVKTNVGSVTNDTALGTGSDNGRDQAGAFGTSTWIHFYYVLDGSTVKTRSSTAAPPTGPALQGTESSWAYAFSIYYNGSSALLLTRVEGDLVYYRSLQRVLTNGVATTETAIDTSAAVPPLASGVQIKAVGTASNSSTGSPYVTIYTDTGSSFAEIYLFCPLQVTGVAFSFGYFVIWVPNVGQNLYYLWSATLSSQAANVDVSAYKVPNGG